MKLKKIVTGFVAAAMMVTATVSGTGRYYTVPTEAVYTVQVGQSSNTFESCYMTWSPVSGADGYNVYVKPEGGSYTKIDSMLIRQYSSGFFRADAVGLKPGKYVMKAVPVISGKEESSKAIETQSLNVVAYDRTGFGWVNGTSSGAYNEDGTLRSNAVVLYITESTKDTVTMDVVTSSKGSTTKGTGIQEILNLYKKGYETRPLAVRIIGEVTDPETLDKGDMAIDGGGKVTCGITIEGIGNDATINGFGFKVKSISNCEIRNLGFMLVDSTEGDSVTLQQDNDHVWLHNCDFFYGRPGNDADQVKGDGALDCKQSTYITFSYNHFWDNGKCNLLGVKGDTIEGLITYHHNWYDHSDSRHPRVRHHSVHVYNNYFDGNAKYGIGSTLGSSIFSENNYFRNCKYPMLISMQGSDIANGAGSFSSEDGGIIKSYGNYMEGQKAFVPYSQNKTEFDAYDASSKDEKVPSSVKSKQGSNTYNNFDTDSSLMYSWTADAAKDVPEIVMNGAGRQGGGNFSFTFDNSKDDEDYGVNTALMSALENYKSSVIAIGSGFDSSIEPVVTTVTDKPVVTTTSKATTVTTTSKTTTVSKVTVSVVISSETTKATVPPVTGKIIYCSPNGKSSAAGTQNDPMDVLTAISKVEAGGMIYLLEGTYKFSETIVIDDKNNGSAGKYKTVMAYPGADVLWDFSAQATADSNRGLVQDGDYWHFQGFEIANAGDNGVLLSGNNNIFELMEFTNNQDTGLQISRYNSSAATIADWPSNNLILNCTSKNNCDDATMENADGFAAKLTCGEGNVFDGCMSYNNSDDGWDLYAKEATGPIGVVTIRNCIAFRNGYTEYGEGFGDCDGNGFKLGGGGIGTAHIVENCLAFENLNCGFTDNNNPKLGSLTNCTAYNNGMGGNSKPNFSCYRCTDGTGCDFKNVLTYMNNSKLSESFPGGEYTVKTTNDKFNGTIENSVYYNSKYYNVKNKTNIANGGKIGDVVTPTDDMFVSLEVAPYLKNSSEAFDFHKGWRNVDGSICTYGFCEVKDTNAFAGLGVKFEQSIIAPTFKGDVNSDGLVNLVDLVSVKKFLIKQQANATAAYDVNEDSVVNVFDFITLKRILIS